MSSDKQHIGNPLADAAQTGVIGGTRQPITAKQQGTEKQTGEQQERVKRTLMFSPYRARWLKIQAAIEGREMSDILEEALATYEQLHPRGQV